MWNLEDLTNNNNEGSFNPTAILEAVMPCEYSFNEDLKEVTILSPAYDLYIESLGENNKGNVELTIRSKSKDKVRFKKWINSLNTSKTQEEQKKQLLGIFLGEINSLYNAITGKAFKPTQNQNFDTIYDLCQIVLLPLVGNNNTFSALVEFNKEENEYINLQIARMKNPYDLDNFSMVEKTTIKWLYEKTANEEEEPLVIVDTNTSLDDLL